MRHGQQRAGASEAANQEPSKTDGTTRAGHAWERGHHRDPKQATVLLTEQGQEDPPDLLVKGSFSSGNGILTQLQLSSGTR